jgi:hypothetical protein
MSTVTYRTPQLPWNEGQSESLFNKILIVGLLLTLALGIVVPNITLPEIKREKAEKLPPQLAKVIKRKKEAPKPKPKPVPKVQEKKVEKKPEPKKEVKPKPAPKKVAPKPKPKPKKVAKKERTPERIKAAKERAKKEIGSFSNQLAAMKDMVGDLGLESIDSSTLTTAGASATDVGSAVDQNAVDRVAGVDESTLTRATGADQLATASRDTTQVKELPKDTMVEQPKDTKVAGLSRSQMQIGRVFEQNKSRYDRIYRKALRSDPTLQGAVAFNITISADGSVTACKASSSEFADKKALRRMSSTCKMQNFTQSSAEDKLEYSMTFYP